MEVAFGKISSIRLSFQPRFFAGPWLISFLGDQFRSVKAAKFFYQRSRIELIASSMALASYLASNRKSSIANCILRDWSV